MTENAPLDLVADEAVEAWANLSKPKHTEVTEVVAQRLAREARPARRFYDEVNTGRLVWSKTDECWWYHPPQHHWLDEPCPLVDHDPELAAYCEAQEARSARSDCLASPSDQRSAEG